MISITRSFSWDAAHRVLGHEGKCRHIHGHRYTAEVTVEASKLDSLGRVIDFSCLKEIIGGWIDKNWDHNVLLHMDDPLMKLWYGDNWNEVKKMFGDKIPFNMGSKNPTAENLAVCLYEQLHTPNLLPSDIKIIHIRLWETASCFCDFYPDSSPLPTR